MNKVILIGRLTRDPDKKSTPQGTPVTTFSIAVQRKFKNQNGEYEADFINCVAWRALADLVAKHFSKGTNIAVVGNLQTRSYNDNDGNKRYVTEVVVDEIDFIDKKKATAPESTGDMFDDLIPDPEDIF